MPRALPGAIIVNYRNAFEDIVSRVAPLSENKRANEEVVVFRPGHYRCNSDSVVLYNHYDGTLLKCDLVKVKRCVVSEISEVGIKRIGELLNNRSPLEYLREYVSDKLQLGSPVTIFVCKNVRGKLVSDRIATLKFRATLNKYSGE